MQHSSTKLTIFRQVLRLDKYRNMASEPVTFSMRKANVCTFLLFSKGLRTFIDTRLTYNSWYTGVQWGAEAFWVLECQRKSCNVDFVHFLMIFQFPACCEINLADSFGWVYKWFHALRHSFERCVLCWVIVLTGFVIPQRISNSVLLCRNHSSFPMVGLKQFITDFAFD